MQIPDELTPEQVQQLAAWHRKMVERQVLPHSSLSKTWVRREFERWKLWHEDRPRITARRKDVLRSFQNWLLKAGQIEEEQRQERRPRQGDAARLSEELANVIPIRRDE